MIDNRKKVFFWQERFNIHEAGHIRGAAELGLDVRVHVNGDVADVHADLGVERPDYGNVIVLQGPAALDEAKYNSLYTAAEVTHIFTGIWAFPFTRSAFNLLRAGACTIIMVSESRNPNGLKGRIRYMHSLLLEGGFRHRVDGVLCIGRLGVDWHRKVGYPVDRLFPYGWCIEDGADSLKQLHKNNNKFRVCYVGQFIKRKNVDLLLSAFRTLHKTVPNVELTLVGGGELQTVLECYASDMISIGCVRFIGRMKNEDVRTFLLGQDLLVLPSKYDGWGAVVNEALLAGCRVLCSTKCGAALLSDIGLLLTFQPTDTAELTSALINEVKTGVVSQDERVLRRLEVISRIGAAASAKYLVDVIDYVRGGVVKKPNYGETKS